VEHGEEASALLHVLTEWTYDQNLRCTTDAADCITVCYMAMKTLGRRDFQGVHKDARLPMKPYINVVPKLLIGLDHGHLGLPLRTRRFAREGPYAAATELGWVVFGPVSGQSTTPSPRSCLLVAQQCHTWCI